MAITYNGTPVTSVLMNGVTYTTIADENGLLYYACNPVYQYGYALACYDFSGFEYCCTDYGGYCARAVICYNGCQNGNGYICWLGGPRTCNTNMTYDTSMEFQLGCICHKITACGYCGTNYEFYITQNPKPVQLYKIECNSWIATCPRLKPTDTCVDISGYRWFYGSNCLLRSPWVNIDYCDYCSRLGCTSVYSESPPYLFPYCAHLNAKLKSSTGCTDFNCSYALNALGATNLAIYSCIQVC